MSQFWKISLIPMVAQSDISQAHIAFGIPALMALLELSLQADFSFLLYLSL